jgi:hypothetical protein
MDSRSVKIPWGRRILLLDRDFQLKYSIIIGCTGTLVIALSIAAMTIARRHVLSDLEIPQPLLSELAAGESRVLWLLGGLAVVTGVVLGFLGVLVTHRIAGPVYVMTRAIAALARGHYPPLRPIRKRDDLKDLVELFQKSIESLRAREVEETFKIEEAILQLTPYVGEPAVGKVVASLRALRDAKSSATGHLSASAQTEAHPVPAAADSPMNLPLRLVGDEDAGR